MTEISGSTIGEFLDSLASKSSTPGGGAAAAMTAALGAAIIEMACSFAIGRRKYASHQDQLQHASDRCREIRARAIELADLDSQVFQEVMDAFRLPRDSKVRRECRKRAISRSAENSARVPLELAELCGELVGLGADAAELGNPNLVADAVGGAALARGAVRICELNVRSNLALVSDDEFVASARRRLRHAVDASQSADVLVERYLSNDDSPEDSTNG
ncbi:MAG: cyclodeaminase/cyclohydrolase family protein [Chloroflexi bacterium]|nr:cyclodeaminase/cyclohydrolase family protein [Chloroflexota bacterium]MCY3937004.1 cyclodeaminase/cyclohydrolase family protein [Chloroflexota bacterium]